MFITLLLVLPIIFRKIAAMEITLPFSVLCRNPTFIDKTSFLSELFNSNDTSIIITSPPGFGKTTMISMIKLFAGVDLKISDNANSTQFKVLGHVNPSAIFQKTKIAHDGEFVCKHQSQYVVLELDIEVDFSDNRITPESIRDKLLDVLLASVESYSTILRNHTQRCQDPSNSDSNSVNSILAQDETQFVDKFFSRNISICEISLALREIIQILSRCLGRKVIVLIDNYDHAAAGFLSKNTNTKLELFYQELNTMIRYASDLFSTSTYMFKILIMSISVVPMKWGAKPQLKFKTNFNRYGFLKSHRFFDFMGFNETEVEQLITRFTLNAEEKRILLTYYDAYQTYPDGKKIYNPRHLTRFIKLYRTQVTGNEVLLNAHRESLKYIGFIGEHLNNRSRLEIELLAIVSNQSVPLKFDYVPPSLSQTVNEIMNHQFSKELAISEMTWSYMFDLGFLTPVVGNSSAPNLYRIANQEAQRVLYKLLLENHNESRLPFNEIGKCSQHFVKKDVILNKQSIASLFGLVEILLGKCINNTAQHVFSKDNELRYQAILYVSSSQFANSCFFVSTMQFRNRANDTYYGVYYYDKNEKICSIVILRNCDEPNKLQEVLLNEAAKSYALPHADVKHLMYAVVNVFGDGHLETFYTSYERYS